jgi:hypothetical protein
MVISRVVIDKGCPVLKTEVKFLNCTCLLVLQIEEEFGFIRPSKLKHLLICFDGVGFLNFIHGSLKILSLIISEYEHSDIFLICGPIDMHETAFDHLSILKVIFIAEDR